MAKKIDLVNYKDGTAIGELSLATFPDVGDAVVRAGVRYRVMRREWKTTGNPMTVYVKRRNLDLPGSGGG